MNPTDSLPPITNLNDVILPFEQEAGLQEIPLANGLAQKVDAGFGAYLGSLLGGIMLLATILTLLYLVWGGIEWITSGGDKGKTEKARDRMTQAVIGLVVLGASVAILVLVQSFLGSSFLKFTGGSLPGGGSGGGGGTATCNASTVGRSFNDGGAGGYCTEGPATVRCNGPDTHLPYPHFDPCSCTKTEFQVGGYDFDSC